VHEWLFFYLSDCFFRIKQCGHNLFISNSWYMFNLGVLSLFLAQFHTHLTVFSRHADWNLNCKILQEGNAYQALQTSFRCVGDRGSTHFREHQSSSFHFIEDIFWWYSLPTTKPLTNVFARVGNSHDWSSVVVPASLGNNSMVKDV
jgi:hypothetical protein